jgi:methylmalonyl-CoA mutase
MMAGMVQAAFGRFTRRRLMSDDSIQFEAEFPEITRQTWRDDAEGSLRGGTYEKKLVSHTLDGLEIHPLYTDDDVDSDRVSQFPATPPYTRGANPVPAEDEAWEIRQEFRKPDVRTTNEEILLDLERGVSGVRIVPDSAFASTSDGEQNDGVVLRTLEDGKLLFGGVHLDMIGTAIRGQSNALGALSVLAALMKDAGKPVDSLRGTVGFDPLGQLVSEGSLPLSWDNLMAHGASLASWTRENAPNVRPIEVSSVVWHEAGATEAREIAFALATGVEYLRGLIEHGVSVDDAANSISFFVASGRDTFIEIAKLRALRQAWARIVEKSGGSEDAQKISMHARSSRMTYSQRDPWVNMLRATSQTFSAAVAGAESITIGGFDEVIGAPDVFSRRIARNTQLVLRDESHIGRISDPAGGSYYIEHLTHTLADRSWSIFQNIESEGGLLSYVQSGKAVADLESIADERDHQIAKRKMPITGVSEFPNLEEEKVERETPEAVAPGSGSGEVGDVEAALHNDVASPDVVDAAIAAASSGASTDDLLGAIFGLGGSVEAPVVRAERYPALWEALRDACDEAAENDNRPHAFLANIGEIPQHRARATYAQNLFQAAGIYAKNNDGFPDVDEAVAAFKESSADIACICSENGVYEEVAAPLATALKEAGAKEVYLAGRPGEHEADWNEAGVDRFVFLGSNVLATLTDTLVELGVISD